MAVCGGDVDSELAAQKRELLTPGVLPDLYEIGPVIGKGGFGSVRRGIVKADGTACAIKILGPRADLPIIMREIAVLKRVLALRDPSLLHLVAAHEDVNPSSGLPRLAIVSQLCSGGELFDRIVARGHYSEKAVADLILVIARALQKLHKAGILHRCADFVKPRRRHGRCGRCR